MQGEPSSMIDWDLAVATAARMAGPGPDISRPDAEAVVAELREGATRSTSLVRDYTGLTAP
ncbi:MAG TPA: zinc-dependent metalloprotease, partial [Nocardioidaceae bacterium]